MAPRTPALRASAFCATRGSLLTSSTHKPSPLSQARPMRPCPRRYSAPRHCALRSSARPGPEDHDSVMRMTPAASSGSKYRAISHFCDSQIARSTTRTASEGVSACERARVTECSRPSSRSARLRSVMSRKVLVNSGGSDSGMRTIASSASNRLPSARIRMTSARRSGEVCASAASSLSRSRCAARCSGGNRSSAMLLPMAAERE